MSIRYTRRELARLGVVAGLAYTFGGARVQAQPPAEMIVHNGRIATLDPTHPFVGAFAVQDGRFIATGTDREVMTLRGPDTTVIDVGGRTVIPGLNDSHTHVIRGGLNYNMELRWDGVPSLADALRMIREQARQTPPPQWVRVVGGWSEMQFAEQRMPTLKELNAAAPDTPVIVVHLYAHALVNRAGLRALGMGRETPNPPGGLIERDRTGTPTGMLIAEPNAYIVYATIARAPRLSHEDQMNSSRHFMRELNRLGVTSVIDAGGGGQNYPDDYAVIQNLHDRGEMTLRIAYNLFAQKPGEEFADYRRWVELAVPGGGDDFLRMHGAGENLIWAAADFENFLLPRPDLDIAMAGALERVARLLATKGWPLRIHATYDQSISRFLDVFERIHGDIPVDRLGWIIDHAETISPRNIERIKALGGGIAIQHRMAFQGEYFIRRYGAAAAAMAPPVRSMLEMGVPVGAGTDATRVASYNPWIGLAWLSTGRTVGGTPLYDETNQLDRMEALRLYTSGSAWFSQEQAVKGTIEPGKYADFAVLSADYFNVPDNEISRLASMLTVVGGKVAHASDAFKSLAPPDLPVSPDWSPVKYYGGYNRVVSTPMQPHRPDRVQTTFASLLGPWGHECSCSGI